VEIPKLVMKRHSKSMSTFTHHLQEILARVGETCIYKDNSRIILVRLTGFSVRASELLFSLEPIQTAGFSSKLPAPFEAGGGIEFLSFKKKYISSPYVNFLLFTEPDDVTHLVNFAATLPELDELLKAFRDVMRAGIKIK
jgi:hypothetical protein